MWYRAGTIQVTNGSNAVVGTGTNFLTGIVVGEGLVAPDGKVYEVLTITNATNLTLGSLYTGASLSSQSYSIAPTQSYIRDLVAQASALVASYATYGMFGAGSVSTPGIAFSADTNTGIRSTGADALAIVTGGADRVAVTNTGLAVTGALSVAKPTGGDAFTWSAGTKTGFLYGSNGGVGIFAGAASSDTGIGITLASNTTIYSPDQTKTLAVSNTGTAVTGTLSATGGITSNNSASQGFVKIDGAATGSPYVAFQQSGVDKGLIQYINATSTLDLTVGAGVAKLSNTGLAVTGTLSATGNISNNSANPNLILNASASGQTVNYYAQTAGVDRISFGKNNTAESGANAGSDFFINRFSDAGVYLGQFLIRRSDGFISAGGAGNFEADPAAFALYLDGRAFDGISGIMFRNFSNIETARMFVQTTGLLMYQAAAAAVNITSSTGTNTALLSATNTGGTSYFGMDNSGGGGWGAGAYALGVWQGGAYPIAFGTNGTLRMVLDSSGNLGIGTASPSTYGKLTVNGNIIFGAPGARNAAFSNYIGIATTGDPSDDARANIAFTTVAGAASSSSSIAFSTNNYGVSGGVRMTLDASGNLGIGVTPSAWYSAVEAIQFSTAGSVWALSGQNNSFFSTNEFLNSSTNPIYIQTGYAMRYQQTEGTHRWLNAPSGTAGNAISFTQAMTLNATGDLLVGTTSSTTTGDGGFTLGNSRTHIYGNSSANSNSTAFSAQKTTLWIENNCAATNSEYAKSALLISSYEGAGSNPGPMARFYRQAFPSAPARVFEVNYLGNIGLGDTNASTSGTGITFPATQSASSDANTLDDYEEGTFTPVYVAQTGTLGTVTYANVVGVYAKVGRLVTVTGGFYCTAFAVGTGSGDLRIGGLPFTNSANVNAISVGDSRLFTLNNPTGGQVGASASTVTLFYRTTANGAINNLQVSNAATGSGALNLVYFTASYQV